MTSTTERRPRRSGAASNRNSRNRSLTALWRSGERRTGSVYPESSGHSRRNVLAIVGKASGWARPPGEDPVQGQGRDQNGGSFPERGGGPPNRVGDEPHLVVGNGEVIVSSRAVLVTDLLLSLLYDISAHRRQGPEELVLVRK
jgi:hypothetical protein